MRTVVSVFITCLVLASLCSTAQKITYSEPEKDDSRNLNFEILGKINGSILVYKNYRDLHYVSTYDGEMKSTGRVKLDFINFRLLDTEFLLYPNFVYMVYQYQKKNIVYCMAVKLDASGKKVGEPVQMDSTENINYSSTNKIYSFISSEDKQKLMVFKINTQNDKAHILTTSLFNIDLGLLKKTKLSIPMPQQNDFLSEFALDNEGDLVCLRVSGTTSNDNINKVSFIGKAAMADNFTLTELKPSNIYMDDVRIKVDNINKHYVITSFQSKNRRGNIDGLYYVLWDKTQKKELLNAKTTFSAEFREDARGNGDAKVAFNDFFLKNVILRKDGGFIIVAESAYTSSRGNTLNRWDYLYGSPSWSPVDYYSWNSPTGYYPWWRSNLNNNNNTLTRYFAENMAVISFDPSGKMEWSNIIRKTQYDDNTDNYIGYGILNMTDQLRFIFNVQEKKGMILSDQSLFPDGHIDRNPTFKNMDQGHDFMPRHAKQIGIRQVIVPCMFRGVTCFAKIEF